MMSLRHAYCRHASVLHRLAAVQPVVTAATSVTSTVTECLNRAFAAHPVNSAAPPVPVRFASTAASLVDLAAREQQSSAGEGEAQRTEAGSTEKIKAMERMVNSAPAELLFERQLGRPKEGWEDSVWGRTLLWVGGYYSKESQATRGGKLLFNVVMEHARDPDVAQGLMLDGRFPSEQGFISLHIWMLFARLRSEGKMGNTVGQTMYDLFQEDVEVRVREAGVKVRISKWLTDLEQRFFGAAMSYDKALEEQDRLKGSEMLVDALWKNVFNAEGDKQAAKLLAKYVRRELTSLAITPSEAVLNGQIRFSRPN